MLDVTIQPFVLFYVIAYSDKLLIIIIVQDKCSFKYFIVVRVLVCTTRIYCCKMSSHQTGSNKPKSSKSVSDTCNTSKDDDLDLLGNDVEAFSGSQADLEGAAENLFSSTPCPQPLHFESLSLRTPQTVPPTPGTALQNKIESKLDKSLGNQFNIQLQQQVELFQASMLEAMKSLREEMQSMKKVSEAEVLSTSASTSKAGPSKQSDPIIKPNPRTSDHSDAQPIETDCCGPSLPPRFTQSVQSDNDSKHSDLQSEHSEQSQRVFFESQETL